MRFLKLTLACVLCLATTAAADGVSTTQGGKKVRNPSGRRGKKVAQKSKPRASAPAVTPTQGYLADEEARNQQEFTENFYKGVLQEYNVALATPDLLQALDNQYPVVKIAAAHILGVRGERAAIPALHRLLGDKEPSVKIKAAEVLVKLGDTSGFGTLLQEFTSRNAQTRLNVVSVGIGFAGTDKRQEVAGLLIRALMDADKIVRAAAAAGLGDIGGPAAIAALRQARASETDEIVKLVIDQQLRKLEQ